MPTISLNLTNLRGNSIGGFNKDFQSDLFLKFTYDVVGRERLLPFIVGGKGTVGFQIAMGFLAIALMMVLCTLAAADDVEPKVLPDRIEDVPVTVHDPFAAFYNFSWRAFVALNWPTLTDAAHRGQPDRARKLGDPGPRVWETWKSRYEVFQRDTNGKAIEPAGWNSYAGKNPCGPDVSNQTKTLSGFTEFADLNQATFKLGKLANPLVAQNRTYTRYEVRFNQQEFDSIADQNHQWYIRDRLPKKENPGKFNLGSVEVKAAWRILTDQDSPATRRRYYVVNDAEVFDVSKSVRAGVSVCSKHDIALVGLHIVIKTKERPQWIWMSFEHVDNVPPIGSGDAREPDAKDSRASYSYNDPTKEQTHLDPAPGSPLLNAVSACNPPKDNPDPMQVIRLHPINVKAMKMNRAYWVLPQVRDTVWANYMLVMTQWPHSPQPEGATIDGDPFPQSDNLANTTMETYQQDPLASSCMFCHQRVSNEHGGDFVAFILLDPKDPPPLALASRPTFTAAARSRPSESLDNDPAIDALAIMLQRGLNQKH